MARPRKIGLDYFPVDVDLFDDDKMMLLSSDFGLVGELIYIKLLCRIYKNGYCIKWDDDQCRLFAKWAGNGITANQVKEVVIACLKRSLFDEPVFKVCGILTSKGIQERYQHICRQLKRPSEISREHDCTGFFRMKLALSPEKTEFPPVETPLIPEESTQKKGKEKKGKEREISPPQHSTFLDRLFRPENRYDLEMIEVQIRKLGIKPEWAKQFNAYLHTNAKEHLQYTDWRSHFANWLKVQKPEFFTVASTGLGSNGSVFKKSKGILGQN